MTYVCLLLFFLRVYPDDNTTVFYLFSLLFIIILSICHLSFIYHSFIFYSLLHFIIHSHFVHSFIRSFICYLSFIITVLIY